MKIEHFEGYLTNPVDNTRFVVYLASLWRQGVKKGNMLCDRTLSPNKFVVQGNQIRLGEFAYKRFILMKKPDPDEPLIKVVQEEPPASHDGGG